MIDTRHLTTLLVTLLLASAPLSAQDAPGTGSSASEQQEQPEQGKVPAPPRNTAASTDPQPSGNATETTNTSPSDYRSSEEISEDLSVSFPVDI